MFTYGLNTTLEGVLVEAKQYAIDQKEAARFTFNDVHFNITSESNLGLAWCAFVSAKSGETVGPCILVGGTKPGFLMREGKWAKLSQADRDFVLSTFVWLKDK